MRELMKIENWSRKRSHKVDGIGVGRIRTVPFSPILFTTPSRKLGCRSRKQKRKNEAIARPGIEQCHRFILRFCLRFRPCSFHLIVSNGVISRISVLLPSPSVWFSLDRIVLRFWVRLRLRRQWKPALSLNEKVVWLTHVSLTNFPFRPHQDC